MTDNAILFPNFTLNIKINENQDRIILEVFPKTLLLFPQGAQSVGFELLNLSAEYFGEDSIKIKSKRRRSFFRLSFKASVTPNNMCLLHVETREIILTPDDAAKFGMWLVESFSAQLNAPRYPTLMDLMGAVRYRIMNTFRRKRE